MPLGFVFGKIGSIGNTSGYGFGECRIPVAEFIAGCRSGFWYGYRFSPGGSIQDITEAGGSAKGSVTSADEGYGMPLAGVFDKLGGVGLAFSYSTRKRRGPSVKLVTWIRHGGRYGYGIRPGSSFQDVFKFSLISCFKATFTVTYEGYSVPLAGVFDKVGGVGNTCSYGFRKSRGPFVKLVTWIRYRGGYSHRRCPSSSF